MSEQRVQILIRLLLRSSLIRIYTVCHSFYIFWRHYFIVKLNCFILRITTVAGLGVPIFRVFTVHCDLSLGEMVPLRGHNVYFNEKIRKIIPITLSYPEHCIRYALFTFLPKHHALQ